MYLGNIFHSFIFVSKNSNIILIWSHENMSMSNANLVIIL
jgi:hypothetical protein